MPLVACIELQSVSTLNPTKLYSKTGTKWGKRGRFFKLCHANTISAASGPRFGSHTPVVIASYCRSSMLFYQTAFFCTIYSCLRRALHAAFCFLASSVRWKIAAGYEAQERTLCTTRHRCPVPPPSTMCCLLYAICRSLCAPFCLPRAVRTVL